MAEINSREVTLLTPTAVPAAGTVTTTPIAGLPGVNGLVLLSKFTYGSGGTSVKHYVQTSIDGGATWIDIACFAFTTASASKLHSVALSPSTPLTPGSAPTDGSLADNTVLDGILGSRYRVKTIVAGTYAGSTMSVYAVFKGNPSR